MGSVWFLSSWRGTNILRLFTSPMQSFSNHKAIEGLLYGSGSLKTSSTQIIILPNSASLFEVKIKWTYVIRNEKPKEVMLGLE